MKTTPPHSSGSLSCDLCGSVDEDELCLTDRDNSYLRTVICRRCGLVYSNPRPDPEQVREYYEHNYRLDYKAVVQPKPKHVYRSSKVALARYHGIAEYLQAGCRVLDFGAGSGEVVYVLRAMGFDASGFEPNRGYAEIASAVLGLPVTHGFYQDANIESESQDFVTSYHVFEHLESPLDALKHVRKWLRPGGCLLVEVPNVEAVCQWPHSRFHRAHLYNFNPATLETTGKKAGFSIVRSWVSSDGGNVATIFQKGKSILPVSGEIPGNYTRVARIVRNHTTLRHLLSHYPYARPFRSLAARMTERRATRTHQTPKEILDGLIASERRAA